MPIMPLPGDPGNAGQITYFCYTTPGAPLLASSRPALCADTSPPVSVVRASILAHPLASCFPAPPFLIPVSLVERSCPAQGTSIILLTFGRAHHVATLISFNTEERVRLEHHRPDETRTPIALWVDISTHAWNRLLHRGNVLPHILTLGGA